MLKIHLKQNFNFKLKKRKSAGLKHFYDSKDFTEYPNDMDDIYKNIERYNPNKKHEMLIVFDEVIADMLSNKKLNPIVTESFIKARKLNISFVLFMQYYLAGSRNIRPNSTYCFIMKIPNKGHLQQNAFNLSSDIDFQEFMNLYKKCTTKLYYFLVIDTTLASDNLLCFRKSLLE